MKRVTSNRRAFTLIELLVVVLIIGILAAVAMPQYTKAVEKARLTEALGNISIMMREFETYVLANGYDDSHLSYPDIANVEITGVTTEKNQHTTGYTMYSKYFDYFSGMSVGANAYYGVTLYRYQGEEKDYLYALDVIHYANGTDEKTCYTHLTDVGNYICTFLESQGWNKEEAEY